MATETCRMYLDATALTLVQLTDSRSAASRVVSTKSTGLQAQIRSTLSCVRGNWRYGREPINHRFDLVQRTTSNNLLTAARYTAALPDLILERIPRWFIEDPSQAFSTVNLIIVFVPTTTIYKFSRLEAIVCLFFLVTIATPYVDLPFPCSYLVRLIKPPSPRLPPLGFLKS